MADLPLVAAAVAGSDAAVYALGLCGAHLTGPERATALDAMAAHRESRERLVPILAAAGAEVPVAQAAYDPPEPVDRPRSARQVAALVEDRCAGQLAAAAGELAGADRTWAAQAAQACARRQAGWAGRTPVWVGAQ